MSKRTITRELYSDANEESIFNELSLFSNIEGDNKNETKPLGFRLF